MACINDWPEIRFPDVFVYDRRIHEGKPEKAARVFKTKSVPLQLPPPCSIQSHSGPQGHARMHRAEQRRPLAALRTVE